MGLGCGVRDVITVIILLVPPCHRRLGNEETRSDDRGLAALQEAVDHLRRSTQCHARSTSGHWALNAVGRWA